MVFQERSDDIAAEAAITVRALRILVGLDERRQVALRSHEARNEREPVGVVQDSREVLGVGANVDGLVGQNFTNSPDTSAILETSPEVLADVLDRVDTNTVDAVVADHVVDPVVPEVDNGLVFGVDVRQRQARVAEPALLDTSLVACVGRRVRVVRGVDETFGVERRFRRKRRRVERRVGGRIRRRGQVIDDNVDHEVHVAFVQLRGKRLEVVS